MNEFKLEEIRVVLTSGERIMQVARDPGIAESSSNQWCKLLAGRAKAARRAEQVQILSDRNRLLRSVSLEGLHQYHSLYLEKGKTRKRIGMANSRYSKFESAEYRNDDMTAS